MINTIKKHKIVVIVVLVDLFLTWLLAYSGIVLPYISPSVESYRCSGTSFPRDYIQKLIWLFMHVPTSLFIDARLGGITTSNGFVFLSVLQTGLIAYYLEKKILHMSK
ncbi:hypothetical protein BD780_001631 [Clostridium tetanomorphum]|uniref:Uncharacterized protein n=1 Tax=Clostridium tetanomorphum TaxID=1553 RepID=A0A923E7M6_CLOTT|nr:hypothetical protein [Clostridium tetanomorphum]KAJ52705.1 hypothetical protein CTM_06956 [Clostridium tetanomorphum DSM 665]MBC2396742.1 hypothetical protein [Clostridium tetanomorphum]MBP1863298.1 hypothetical protein [Clostridium tetanomorphum]NRS84406.1 hypothetical protein [Clostridium tetanomorphum]NRZ97621.1 hypothetical protein [Clostridium tetanomorphum]